MGNNQQSKGTVDFTKQEIPEEYVFIPALVKLMQNDLDTKKNALDTLKNKKADNEIIPLQDDIDEYMKKNVLPYNPLAYLDRSKDKVGYEVPFTRLFYKFVAPIPSDDIFAEIKALEAEETVLMNELFHKE